MSPYEVRYIDVKFIGEVSGSVTVAVEEGLPLPLVRFQPNSLSLSNIFTLIVISIFMVPLQISSDGALCV